jgi:hypothetical protein
VGDILESYLKAVCGIYAEQKAIRVQKELELQKLSRLEIKALRGMKFVYFKLFSGIADKFISVSKLARARLSRIVRGPFATRRPPSLQIPRSSAQTQQAASKRGPLPHPLRL